MIALQMRSLRPPDRRGANVIAGPGNPAAKLKWLSDLAGDCRFDHRHIPQRIPIAWYERHFAGPGDVSPRALRRAVAIYLIQLSCALSVKDTSALLGIPHGRSLSSVFTITRWASDPANARRLAAGLQTLISELNNTPCLTDYGHRRDTLATWSTPSRLADAVRGHQYAAPGRHSRAAVAHGPDSRPFLQKYRCPAAETDGIADGRQRRAAQHRVDDSAGWASPPVEGRNLCGQRRDGSAFPAVAERRSRLHFMAQIRPSCMWRPRLAWPGLDERFLGWPVISGGLPAKSPV